MRYESIYECLNKVHDIPLIIPTFNNVTYTRNIVDFFYKKNFSNIIILDNASSFEPMIDYLNVLCKDLDVVFQKNNYGPRQINDESIYKLLPEYFIVTDPDLGFNSKFPVEFINILVEISNAYSVFKVGSALNLDIQHPNILDNEYIIHNATQTIRSIEQSYYVNKVGENNKFSIWKAPIDTTFALYNKKYMTKNFFDGLRLDGIFLADHYGWFNPPPIPEKELLFYTSNIFEDISSTEVLKKYGRIYSS